MSELTADLVGELLLGEQSAVKPADIPLAAGITEAELAELLAQDSEPMQVVARIAPGSGGRQGWLYTPRALEQLADEVAEHGLPGFLGHDHAGLAPERWGTPVVRWI